MKLRSPTSWDDVPVIFDLPYACLLLGRTPESLKRMAISKKLPAHKLGGEWRFDKDELRAWLLAQ